MRLLVDGLEVLFPYSYIYPEQYAYMVALKNGLDARGPIVLEMPSGTGKTVTLLSLILAYRAAYPDAVGPLVYCSRTVGEVEKVVEELRRVVRYREHVLAAETGKGRFLGLAMSARRNLCIHPDVVCADAPPPRTGQDAPPGATLDAAPPRTGAEVDAACRLRTSPWARQQAGVGDIEDLVAPAALRATEGDGGAEPSCATCARHGCAVRDTSLPGFAHSVSVGPVELCHYFENFMATGLQYTLEGIYSLEDLKDVGRQRHWCPYFLARHLINVADVVVFSYPYLLDPKISDIVSAGLSERAVVVFDEAHNIDNVCIEVLSVKLTGQMLTQALGNISSLGERVADARQVVDLDAAAASVAVAGASAPQSVRAAVALGSEYTRLRGASPSLASRVRGLRGDSAVGDAAALAEDRTRGAVPGNMRRAEHYLGLLRRFVYYLRRELHAAVDVKQQSAARFLEAVYSEERIEARSLKFVHDRFAELVRTLEISDLSDLRPLATVIDFATLVATYHKGFLVIFEPIDSAASNPFFEPQIQFACLDSSIAFQPVLKRFRSIVVTSGTLSPLDIYPKILNFRPAVTERFPMSVSRPCICPMMVTRGSDQVALTTRFELRQDNAVVRNYGALLSEIAGCVPDGVVCFFTSYRHLEDVVAMWSDMGMLVQILKHKLLFIETPDATESTLALANYRRACDRGRGAILLAIARGKISEGIDFDHHYARAVILFGVPYVNTRNLVIQARLQFLQLHYGVKEAEFLTFDAMRHAAQCVGRVIRGKTDYGVMIFADKRFARSDKRTKLPHWVAERVLPAHLNLSTDMAVNVVREFLKEMGQPVRKEHMLRVALWTERELPAAARPPSSSTT